jgi:DtxR family Mn-dependent transcriptional regulator
LGLVSHARFRTNPDIALDEFGAANYDACGEHGLGGPTRAGAEDIAMAEDTQSQVLSESLQDYLEVVYLLVHRHSVARMKEIAALVGVGKSSVTGAIQALAERGLVNYGPYQYVTLTEAGLAAGRELLERHRMIRQFLMDVLGVPEAEAETVGCKMEHAIKGEVLDRFVQFLGFVRSHPAMFEHWVADFDRFRERSHADAEAGGPDHLARGL